MFVNTKVLVSVVACALLAQAQSTTSSAASSTPTLDACIQSCLVTASGPDTCVDPTNLTCSCTSSSFQKAVLGCLQVNCTATDLGTAAQLQQTECAGLNSSTSSTASYGTATSSSSASSASATKSNAANALAAPLSLGGIFGTLVASAGALVGAAFVL